MSLRNLNAASLSAICDISLMHFHPAETFYHLLNDLDESLYSSPSKLYKWQEQTERATAKQNTNNIPATYSAVVDNVIEKIRDTFGKKNLEAPPFKWLCIRTNEQSWFSE